MTLSDSSWNILIIQYFKSHPIFYSTIIQTIIIQTRFMCSIVILVPLNHSNSIKSFNIVSFPYSLTHSIFLAFIRLVSFNILHKCNSISFTNCVSFTIVPYTMCQLLSFNVLSYSKRFIQTCYFKNISIIHFHSTYYHSQSSSFNILIQECFNHSIAHLSFNISIQSSLIIQ